MCISDIAYPNHTHHTPISHTSLVGLMPLCENMPSGTAVKPGDVVYAMNGKSIEVRWVCLCVCVCVCVFSFVICTVLVNVSSDFIYLMPTQCAG